MQTIDLRTIITLFHITLLTFHHMSKFPVLAFGFGFHPTRSQVVRTTQSLTVHHNFLHVRQLRHGQKHRWNPSLNLSSSSKPPSSSTSISPIASSEELRQKRIETLHNQLQNLGVDAKSLSQACETSQTTTSSGFDPQYGKSAIKTYRTYIDPKPSKLESLEEQDISISSLRVARQIDFLAKRHRSHEAEWVRHTDEDVSERTVFPLVILLDNVRSAFNVGSIFRTADACGVCLVLTTGITPHPGGNGGEKVAKSSLGAERIVPSQHFETTQEAIEFVRESYPKLELVGMETTNLSVDYTKVEYPGKGQGVGPGGNPLGEGTLLVLGNEVTGVDTEILSELDQIVEIPMFGVKNSLNIAACAPVVLYEILRQWDTR